MNVTEMIHYVISVEATSYYPANSNAVTFQIVTDSGSKSITLFFGDLAVAAKDLYLSLDGDPAKINHKSVDR